MTSTLFVQDEDGAGAFTTDRDEFARAQKPCKKVKRYSVCPPRTMLTLCTCIHTYRSASDRGPHPLISRTNLPLSAQQGSKEKVYPYSCVSQEMEDKLDHLTDKLSSKSAFDLPLSDRYRKLENDSFVYGTETDDLSDPSMYSSANIGTSPSSSSNHKDSMARIREDISRYKCDKPPAPGGTGKETVIPKVSSKWTQFMCEEDSEGEEDDELLRNFGSGVVSSGSAVAQYS